MKNLKTKTSAWVIVWSLLIAGTVGLCFYSQAEAYDQILTRQHAEVSWTAPRIITDVRTTKEVVWDLLTEEGGLSFDEAMDGMAMISRCENPEWDPYAINVNKGGTKDLGIFQINEHFHPDYGRACLFDVYCNTRAAIDIYHGWDNSWSAWTCSR